MICIDIDFVLKCIKVFHNIHNVLTATSSAFYEEGIPDVQWIKPCQYTILYRHSFSASNSFVRGENGCQVGLRWLVFRCRRISCIYRVQLFQISVRRNLFLCKSIGYDNGLFYKNCLLYFAVPVRDDCKGNFEPYCMQTCLFNSLSFLFKFQ